MFKLWFNTSLCSLLGLAKVPDSDTRSLDSARSEPSLSNQIMDSFKKSRFPTDTAPVEFLPRGKLDKLITEEAVAHELGTTIAEQRELIRFLCGPARQVFASTILATSFTGPDLQNCMTEFQALKFTDVSLPVKAESFSHLLDNSKSLKRKWTKVMRRHFDIEQYKFLAPVFPSLDASREDLYMVLDQRDIFPFTAVDSERRQGAFSYVYQVTIHPSHQKSVMKRWDGTLANAAIKELKASCSEGQTEEAVYKEWKAEATALSDLRDLHHQHIIQVRAIITRESKRYFMFEWADGGSLRDFYRRYERPSLDTTFVEEIVRQLRGLADALSSLHNYKEDTENWRHGDLKPENILIVRNQTEVGIWKVADMGLAKHHYANTHVRGVQTSTLNGTTSYEPPEVTQNVGKARSRLYDIWSMGCITLELLIWLLYGYEWLRKFNDSLRNNDIRANASPYWQLEESGDGRVAKVHSSVAFIMGHIANEDPECVATEPTAIKDLIRLVLSRLLVVALPEQTKDRKASAADTHRTTLPSFGPTINIEEEAEQSEIGLRSGPGSQRATAQIFCSELDIILEKGRKNKNYWFSNTPRDGVSFPPIPTINSLSAPSGQSPLANGTKGNKDSQDKKLASLHVPPVRSDLDLNKFWDFPVDNPFAETTISRSKIFEKLGKPLGIANLCERCQKLDVWSDGFRFTDRLSDLKRQSPTCDFCMMRFNLCTHLDARDASTIRFDRLGSTLRINESYPPVLSICRASDPAVSSQLGRLQVGLPILPDIGSDAYFAILQHWLEDCDTAHPDCRPLGTFSLPTRLVYVGPKKFPSVRLYKTEPRDKMKYFALSHPWGKSPPEPFCTYTTNEEEHNQGINFDELPPTFQHAVSVTRALGIEYIWIDSLCIIQGPDGDFNEESKHMESVYSKAHCVLAASSATGQQNGFLNTRKARDFITFKRDKMSPFHVCEFIDDFDQHVLEGPLNQRGWVLQERALARRTIYFTNTQTYFECGQGVRCETLTKTQNKLAAFLGDSSFPKVAMESSHGGKIRLYQDLYMQYSRLAFTRQSDRPVAIAGLEKRLIESLRVHGGLGMFDDNGPGMFRRSLLWQRGTGQKNLQRIDFGVSPLPSWSWMAYSGGIDYLDPPFGQIEWETNDISSPWSPNAIGEWYSSDKAWVVEIEAFARDFNRVAAESYADAKIIYDIQDKPNWSSEGVKCVVLGRSKIMGSSDRQLDNQRHWILVVHVTASKSVPNNYSCRRLGVGYVPKKWISLGQRGISVKIQ